MGERKKHHHAFPHAVVTVRLNRVQATYLQRLLDSGFYGLTPEDTVIRALDKLFLSELDRGTFPPAKPLMKEELPPDDCPKCVS